MQDTKYHLGDVRPALSQVLIFAENKADVDDIHERLLTVAVEAVSIHGGKDQEEREAAIKSFKAGTKVLLPTAQFLLPFLEAQCLKRLRTSICSYGVCFHASCIFTNRLGSLIVPCSGRGCSVDWLSWDTGCARGHGHCIKRARLP